jgi:benzoate-CoA ligase family protein
MSNMSTGTAIPDDLHMAEYFLFARLREGKGEKVAIRYGERAYSYATVAERSKQFAGMLQRLGVRRGERVLIILPDAPPFAWAIFGTLTRGAVVAMGNPEAPQSSISYLVKYTRAAVVVTIPRVADMLRAARPDLGPDLLNVLVVPETKTGGDPEAPSGAVTDDFVRELSAELAAASPMEPVPMHKDEPCYWLFTSGSTGEPKANVHSHRDFIWNTEVYAKATVGYREGDMTVSVPRLFFGYATGTNLFFPFAVGATTGLFCEKPSPESLAWAIETYRATVVTNVPTMLGKLLEHDEELAAAGKKRLDFDAVRFSMSAGEALPEPLLRKWQARFSSDVYDGIGSAEMFHIYASNRPGDIKPGSLGKVVAGYELRVLPEDAEGAGATPCAPGEIGVLWVKGDSVSHGYHADRDKSWKTFHGHWCRTGDLFKMDEEGYLYFAGRADDLLKVGGQWVAPVEVEECLMRHPAVSIAAVIGVEQDGLVKTKAFVVKAKGAPEDDAKLAEELQVFVQTKLAKYKYPRIVQFVPDLPKNDRGKVDKKALKAEG